MASQAELRARLDAINQRDKERRAALQARKAKLLAQLRAASRPSKTERRRDARRKILLGAFLLDQLEVRQENPASFEFNGKRFADWLVRPTDRAMFEGLPMLPATPSPATGSPAHRVAEVDTPLNVPYSDKDQVKALGARWIADQKRWVIPAGCELAPFRAWLEG
ncbi:MAG: DUF5710 domain-containing protein [Steroidobacteraceae bacterium]